MAEIQQECEKLHLKLSNDTRKFLIFEMLKSLGPSQSQRLISKFVDKGIITWEEEFEVEAVLDHWKDEDKVYYLIKWHGWGNEYNSWEPEENLCCEDILKEYHKNVAGKQSRKRKFVLSGEDFRTLKKRKIDELFHKLIESKLIDTMSPLDMITFYSPVKKKAHQKGLLTVLTPNTKLMRPKSKNKKLFRSEVLKALKEWENQLNAIIKGYDPAPLFVENNVDLEGPPDNFIYINERKEGPGVIISKDPLIGCECEDCYECRKTCCPVAGGAELAYYKSNSRLKVPRGVPIFECNVRCNCGSDCLNRVAQKGRKYKLCIFRTANGRGWGVKSLQIIKKGAFVIEYVGEVITNEEAESRGKEYDAVGRTYLFDLDFNDPDAPFSVDAGTYGNAAHFINHSCDPNLEVHVVWINTLDPRLPHICLYAKRDIKKDEELTFDYMSGNLMQEEKLSESHKDVSSTEPISDSESHKDLPSTEPISDNESHKDLSSTEPISDSESQKDLPSTEPLPDSESHKDLPSTEPLSDQIDNLLSSKAQNEKSDMLTKLNNMPTPPSSDTESVGAESNGNDDNAVRTSKFSMACLCGTTSCRKFLFF